MAATSLRSLTLFCLVYSCLLAACDERARTDDDVVSGQHSQALSTADCPAGYRVIRGSEAAETITGTSGNDCIIALGGNDVINGAGGNDYIAAGEGDDTVYGGSGNDAIYGEAGNDSLYGEGGADTIDGGDGDDLAEGSTGQDTLLGGSGRDKLSGGDTEDVLRGGPDDDVLHGDNANDQLYGDDGDDVLDGDANADTLSGGNGDDALYGDAGNDILNGEAGDDALIGGAGTNTIDGGAGTDACSGTRCERPALTLSGCTANAQCGTGQRCIADFGLCLGCVADQDGDGTCDSKDGCPADPQKTIAGVCGCGVSDADSDNDGRANCVDACPADAAKQSAGICGCGVSDVNSDGDGLADCLDGCPGDPTKIASGACGCGVSDQNNDGDSAPDCTDGCPGDGAKVAPGVCGCGVSDGDTDGDGLRDCQDACPSDAQKTTPGVCGCSSPDTNSDGDAQPDCVDRCPGFDDAIDGDGDSVPDGCDLPHDCTYNTVGIGVHVGDAWIDDDGDVAALSGTTCIAGSLYVEGQVTDLHGLASLNAVAGAVFIQSTALTSLDGLEGLTSIPGMLSIGFNPALDNIHALYGITSLGQLGWSSPLTIANNASLPPCQVWEIERTTHVQCPPGYCGGNDGTEGCGSLPADFACVPGASGPGVYDGEVYLSGGYPAPNLNGVTCITGGLWVTDGANLNAFTRLQKVGGTVWLSGIPETDLSALAQLSEIGGALEISSNESLRDISALNHLTRLGSSSGGFAVWMNPSLPACQVWELADRHGKHCTSNGSLDQSCVGNTGIGSCGALPADFACVPGARGPGVFDGSISASGYAGAALREYGGVTCVTGSVWIDGAQDLSPLQGLQEIGEALYLTNSNVTDLGAFGSLREIGSDLHISSNSQLQTAAGLARLTRVGGVLSVTDNPLLRDLSALDTLTAAMDVQISFNPALPACHAWGIAARSGLPCATAYGNRCPGNTGTGSCGDLPSGFACVPGARGPGVYDGIIPGNAATNEFGGLTCITGDLMLSGELAADRSWLAGLEKIGGSLVVWGQQDLTSLSGLENLSVVGGHVLISDNPSLTTISALGKLRSVASGQASAESALDIRYNPQLPACEVLTLASQVHQSCDFCYQNTGAGGCAALPDDFACVPGASGPGVLDGTVYALSTARAEALRGVTCVTGDLMLNYVEDLSAFSALQKVGGNLHIGFTQSLANVDALSQLTSVAGDLRIYNNQTLSSLHGLRNLASLGGSGDISYNPALPACWGWDLQQRLGYQVSAWANDGQGRCGSLPPDFRCEPGAHGPGVWDGSANGSYLSLVATASCITGALVIDSTSLSDLSALAYLEKVGGNLEIYGNQSLTSVDGLENLTSIGGSLRISNNSALSNLHGLASLSQLGQQSNPPFPLEITFNESLPACWGPVIEQRTGVVCGDQFTAPNLCQMNSGSGDCPP